MSDLNPYVIKTYRYQRLGIVALTVTLAAAVVIEILRTDPTCVLPSISAYYYMPAQAVFVAVLVAIGVSMIALKAKNEWEDVLLNMAGMLAPVVAFVPTPKPGSCSSVTVSPSDAYPNIVNNVWALFATGVVVVASGIFLAIKARIRPRSGIKPGPWNYHYTVGFAVSLALSVGGILWLTLDPTGFARNAHYTAAITLFVCFIVVTGLNAWAFGRQPKTVATSKRPYANRYSVIATLMLTSAAVIGLITRFGRWQHGVLAIEAVLITLFAAFWLSQTQELWDQGLRDEPAEAPRNSTGTARHTHRSAS